MKTKTSILLLMAASFASCFHLPKFPPASLVDRPRILAVIADPPEVTPKTGTSLTIVVGGNKQEPSEVRWTACGMPSSMLGTGNQFGDNTADRGCNGQVLELGEGQRIELQPQVILAALTNDDLLRASLGANLPPAALEQIRTTVGFAATVDVELTVDGKHLGALKRVILSENEHPSTNPPPPSFRFGKTTLRSMGEVPPYRCEPNDGELHAKLGETIELAPAFDGDEEPWLEDYRVLDARGIVSERTEQAFYAWYSDAGELDHGTTSAPDRSNGWHAPDKDACVQLWLVVRDGHGGQTACTSFVSVGNEDQCPSE